MCGRLRGRVVPGGSTIRRARFSRPPATSPKVLAPRIGGGWREVELPSQVSNPFRERALVERFAQDLSRQFRYVFPLDSSSLVQSLAEIRIDSDRYRRAH